MNKDLFRKQALLARKSIPYDLREQKSLKICERVLALNEFKTAKTVMLYMSYKSEVSTSDLIQKALSCGKRVVFPLCIEGTSDMVACSVDDINELKSGSFGIYEPDIKNRVDEREIDFVVVPGVAFDKDGNRMGYGKGYYDRFLPKLRDDCFVVGLTFSETMFDYIAVSEYDFRMKKVIFE